MGLTLNLPRVRLQRAYAVALGVSVANSRGRVDGAIFEAVAETEEEAEELTFRTNAERAKQALLDRHGLQNDG